MISQFCNVRLSTGNNVALLRYFCISWRDWLYARIDSRDWIYSKV